MSRYAMAQAAEAQPTIEGDERFIGLNMKLDKTQLGVGYFCDAINIRVPRGVVEKRRGTIKPAFANAVSFGAILGSGIYSNPNGTELLLVATPSKVYGIQDSTYPREISLPAGLTLDTPVTFSQQFDRVLLHRGTGTGKTTLVWSGSAATGFVEVTKSNPADGSTVLIPNADWSTNMDNRAVFPISRDTLGASDILDYTSYDEELASFRINTGTSDEIVGAYPYAQSSILVGKRRSWDILNNFIGDLSNATMEVLSTEIGIVARLSAKMVGGDLFFLDDTGIYRITQVIQDRLEASPVAVSEAIEPLIKRINRAYAHKAVAAVHGFYYYLAVPIDGSSVNNAMIVYNTVTKECEGYDLWAGSISVDELHVALYGGERRVFCVDHVAGAIYVLYEGKTDLLVYGEREVVSELETRAYSTLGWNAATARDFKRIEISVATWRPSITMTELTDKASDERVLTLTPITKNPAKYDVFGRRDYVLDNSNNDFDVVGRQDYSVPDGLYLQGGINIEKKQESVLRFSTKARGRAMSYRIRSSQGECDIKGVLVESSGSQREMRRAA